MGGLRGKKLGFLVKICYGAPGFLKIRNKHIDFLPIFHCTIAKNDKNLFKLYLLSIGKNFIFITRKYKKKFFKEIFFYKIMFSHHLEPLCIENSATLQTSVLLVKHYMGPLNRIGAQK